MYKVKGNPELVRDPESGAILNCSRDSYKQAILRKRRQTENQKRLDCLEKSVSGINSDMQEIKELLKSFLQSK